MIDIEKLNEMEVFNIKRRDIISFKEFAKAHEVASKLIKSGKIKDAPLKEYLHKIERIDIFGHPSFDSTYNMLDKAQGKKVKDPTIGPQGVLYAQSLPQN